MKLQALMIAVALAAGGAAYAQAPNGSAKAPADTGASTSMNSGSTAGSMSGSSMDAKKTAKSHRKMARKSMHKAHKEHTAMNGRGMNAMGAGADPMVDLNSNSRQRRMDQAYNDWQSRGSR